MMFTQQGMCVLKECGRHLVDGGKAKGGDTLNIGREVGGVEGDILVGDNVGARTS